MSALSDAASLVAPPGRPGWRRPAVAAIAGFALFAAWLARDAVGVPSIVWMNKYAPQDFPTFDSLLALIWKTRLPLPPIQTFAEVLNYQLDGSTRAVTEWLYRFCLVASYVLALWLARGSPIRLAAALALSVVFLWATLQVHASAPWVYDILLPMLLLAFFSCLDAAAPDRRANGAKAFLGGLFLALAELTRPYVLLLMPLLLLGAAFRLWPLPMRARLAFLAPVLALSGGWHLHQYADLGQIVWSNHGGFNLLKAWQSIEVPPLAPEPNAPAASGRGPRIDTAEHNENSRRLTRAVLAHVAANPDRAAIQVGERMANLLSAPTSYANRASQHWVLTTQLDPADVEIQLPEIVALFRTLPRPSILIADLVLPGRWPAGDQAPPEAWAALAALRAEPGTAWLTNEDTPAGRAPVGDWIVARGFRAVASRRCDGAEPHRPGLIQELAPAGPTG